MVAGALRVSSPGLGRFFLQFGEDLFGFATYGFLWVALSYLFHLSIRVVVELGDEVLIPFETFIDRIEMICCRITEAKRDYLTAFNFGEIVLSGAPCSRGCAATSAPPSLSFLAPPSQMLQLFA